MRKLLIILISVLCCNSLSAQYYQNALGKTGNALKVELHDLIDNHLVQNWPLWTHFQTTDDKVSGHVWDMYSDIPGGTPPYTFNFSNTCGQYSDEGDCFNHEHLWPKTYCNGNAYPTRSDLHHLVPTDGYVNNKRGSFPFGEVSNVAWTSDNGSRTGTSSTYPTSSQVFEPIDSFKGDIARACFYMSVRYDGEDAAWTNWEMANGADLTTQAIALLIAWHNLDPVSQKELDRNERVYQIQGNRNPFVDYPQFVECIWGTSDCTPLSIDLLSDEKISVFPNPVDDILNIENARKSILLDVSGKVLVETYESTIDMSVYRAGLYFLLLEKGDEIGTQKIIKK